MLFLYLHFRRLEWLIENMFLMFAIILNETVSYENNNMWTSVINSKVSIHISIQMNNMCKIFISRLFFTDKMWNNETMRREHIVKDWTKSWEPRIILMLITNFVIIWKKLITFHLIKYNLIYKNRATFWSEFYVNMIWNMNKFESMIFFISLQVCKNLVSKYAWL